MTPENEYGGALFIPELDDTAKGFTVATMATQMREPGIETKYLANQIRHFAQSGYIHPFGQKGSGRTAHNLYSIDQLFACKILNMIADTGTSDASVLRAASLALNSWRTEDLGWSEDDIRNGTGKKPSRSPAMFVIKNFIAGNVGWIFEQAVFRHKEHGLREVPARVRNLTTGFKTTYRVGNEFEQRSITLIDLDLVLTRLLADKGQVN